MSKKNIIFLLRKPKMSNSFCFSEIIYDQLDHSEENDGGAQDKTELRISQPKYSKLLKDLDFSHTRMVNKNKMFLYFCYFLKSRLM